MLNKKAKPPKHYLCDVCGNEHYVKYDRTGSKRGRWISCTVCNVWVHDSCVGWTDNDIDAEKHSYVVCVRLLKSCRKLCEDYTIDVRDISLTLVQNGSSVSCHF